MEYAPDGDLSKVIKKWQMMRRPMPEDLIWKYFIQVCMRHAEGRSESGEGRDGSCRA
jgi:NIMA (never in mitosis gene a)-related kinase